VSCTKRVIGFVFLGAVWNVLGVTVSKKSSIPVWLRLVRKVDVLYEMFITWSESSILIKILISIII
jgi:hypothetical protein